MTTSSLSTGGLAGRYRGGAGAVGWGWSGWSGAVVGPGAGAVFIAANIRAAMSDAWSWRSASRRSCSARSAAFFRAL